MGVSLPGVEQAVDRAATLVLDKKLRVIALTGTPGSGKTSALVPLGQRLAAAGRHVIHIRLPTSDDAAGVALAEGTAQLGGAKLIDRVKDPKVPWAEKVDGFIGSLNESTTLLIDDPVLSETPAIDPIFWERAHTLSHALLATKASVVVATTRLPSFIMAPAISVQPASVPAEILERSRWNGLGERAQEVLSAGGDSLKLYSPLELRLLVALADTGVSIPEVLKWRPDAMELVNRLIESLEAHAKKKTASLRKVLGRLAVLRLPFDESYLQTAGASGLDAVSASVLRRALLFGEQNAWTLHDLLAQQALLQEWLNPSELAEAHRLAADHYRRRFEAATKQHEVFGAIRSELELIHHRTEAADPALLDESLFFVEQYDALGRTLSKNKQYSSAVKAYERALEHDPQDWYAHHYRAYNLDMQGLEPDKIEAGYKEARRLKPDHYWNHGRLISFCVTLGRMTDAREAWALAKKQFSSPDERLYTEVHKQVARVLLHRGELEFARRVLDDVPPAIRHRLDWEAGFRQYLQSQVEAERNELVFPPHIPLEERWERGPHLIDSNEDRPNVVSWRPGRIAAIDDQVHVLFAVRMNGTVRFEWADYTHKAFKRICPERGVHLQAGTFVELVEIRRRGTTPRKVLLDHPRIPVDLLGPIYPRPDRFLVGSTS